MRVQRIRILSTIVMILVGIFCLYWTYDYSVRIIPHITTADWSTYNIVDNNLAITTQMRIIAALFYAPVYITAFVSYYYALRLLNSYRQGIIIDIRPAYYLMGLGLSLLAVIIVETFIASFEGAFLSQWNQTHQIPVEYYFDSLDLTVAFAGLGFCLVGWVTREAILMKEEVEAFV